MLKRTVALPALLLPKLDQLLDKLMDDYQAGRVPEFGQTDLPGTMFLQLTIERPSMALPFTAVPKPIRRIDPLYRDWIRQRPCVVVSHGRGAGTPCGTKPDRPSIECCHLRTRGAFGEDRQNCFPACPVHHDEQEGRTVSFKARYGIQLHELVLEFDSEYESEVHPFAKECVS